jgi:hypothetical protein
MESATTASTSIKKTRNFMICEFAGFQTSAEATRNSGVCQL